MPAYSQSTAVHEAGHAVAGAVLGAAPISVAIFDHGGGECEFAPEAYDSIGVESRLAILAAGCQAQWIVLIESPARALAFPDYEMMRQATAGLHPAWAQQLRQQAHDTARQLVTRHQSAVVALANKLLDSGRLSGSDVRRILRTHGL